MGFISAIPAHIQIYDKYVSTLLLCVMLERSKLSPNSCFCNVFVSFSRRKKMVEINFLCVHKKLRSKRVAPVLIREITRRVNCKGLFQAVYTAGVVLPRPVASCR